MWIDRLDPQVTPGHLVARHVANVVDKNVKSSEPVEDLGGESLHVIPTADVALNREGLESHAAHGLGHGVGALARAVVVDRDMSAFPRQAKGDGGAETPPGAGHQGEPVL